MHSNSKASFASSKESRQNREAKIVKFLKGRKRPLTDRQIAARMGFTDMNAVRPQITRLVTEGVLFEHASVKCDVTGKTVRTTAVFPFVTEQDGWGPIEYDKKPVVALDIETTTLGGGEITKKSRIGQRFVVLKDATVAGAEIRAGEVWTVDRWTDAFNGNWVCNSASRSNVYWNDAELATPDVFALVVDRPVQNGDRLFVIKTGTTDNWADLKAGEFYTVRNAPKGAGHFYTSRDDDPYSWCLRHVYRGEWFLNIGPAQ